jgi:hypothetical protein
VTEKLLRLVAWNSMSVVIHDDFGHVLGEVVEFEFDVDAASIRIDAVPNEFGKRLHGLSTCLSSHEIIFDLNFYVFDGSHAEHHTGTIFPAKEQKIRTLGAALPKIRHSTRKEAAVVGRLTWFVAVHRASSLGKARRTRRPPDASGRYGPPTWPPEMPD